MPSLNFANLITTIRLIFGIPIIYFIYINEKTISISMYLIFLFLDILDGFVARKLKCETVFGKNFDFAADNAVAFLIAAALLFKGQIPPLYALLISIPLVMYAIAIYWGVKLLKNTYIQAKWRKLDGIVSHLTILSLLINSRPSIILVYLLLIYIYISRIKHLVEIKKMEPS